MKKILCVAVLCFAMSAVPAYSHHPAADYVDEEIYAMIDEMVSDTPHADLVFEDEMGNTSDTSPDIMGEMDEDGDVVTDETIDVTIITAETVRDVEDLMKAGILTEVSRLNGDVMISIDLTSEDSVTMTIMQVE